MSFRESNEPGGDAVKKYKCDVCDDHVVDANRHNSKCDFCDKGYYTIPVFE